MNVVFVDWTPINSKSDIRSGGHIRRYYAWISFNKVVDKLIPFRKKDGSINWKAVIKMFRKDSVIWVEYGCGGVAHLFVLLASFIPVKKHLILNVHDIVEQQRAMSGEYPFLKRVRLEIVERLLLNRTSVIILSWPRLLDYFTPKKNQKVIIMVPGVGEDELFIPSLKNDMRDKKIKTAVYFGSMQRKGMIPMITELFSELNEWELHLIGLKEGEKIAERENVRYLGVVSHNKLQIILDSADVILISLPKYDYFDKAMHIKLGYALKSCKPVIATRLRGISEYVSMVGLEENVIYVEEWHLDSLKDALQKAKSLNIDVEKTIEKLKPMAWEPRFRKAMKIALVYDHKTHEGIEWI